MANHKSAAKRARGSQRRNVINSRTLAGVRTIEKKVRAAITAKKKDEGQAALVEFMSVVGKAAQKGRVHTSTASRKIARLSKAVNAL